LASDKHDVHTHDLGLEHFELVSDEGVSLDAPPPLSGDARAADADSPDATGRPAPPELLRNGSAAVPVLPSSILEALLFVGNGPISAEQAAKLIRGVRPEHVEQLVADLDHRYQDDDRPYRIVASADGFRLKLSGQFDRIVDRLYHRRRAVRISPAAVEVLALVAYRQPINRQTVENLRGADCGGILRQLVRRGLLRIERNGTTSRDVLYHTTDRFLEVFCLERLDELPRAEDLDTL
jgi:segregation and condensation protein B